MGTVAAGKGPSTPDKQGVAGTCGLSPIPIRGAATAAAFDPFALVGSIRGGDRSPLQMWTDRAQQTLAKVTASESHDECDVNGDVSNVKEVADVNLFSKDLIGTEFESFADGTRNEGEGGMMPVVTPPTPVSPPKTKKAQAPSLYAANKGDGLNDDEVPSLEWSFTSHQSFGSAASSSGAAASRAGQFLSHVVGRCYGCSEEVDAETDANHREQQQAYFVQQLHDVKEKSASVVDEAMRVVVALLGDTVPSMVVAMTSKRSSRHRRSDDDPFRTARRHRRFPSASSTFDYSESQNPTTTGEMSHYTTSDGEGTSFDDDYYDDEEDDEEEYEGDDDDATQSSTRGGSAVGGGSFDAGGREGAAASAGERHGDTTGEDDGSDVYSPRVKNSSPTSRPPRARPDGSRKGGSSRNKSFESVSPSFNTSPPTSWMKDPLVKVNQGVQKLFGEASVALSHHPPAAAQDPNRRRRDELERAKDRFAC
jgi:cytochrome c553